MDPRLANGRQPSIGGLTFAGALAAYAQIVVIQAFVSDAVPFAAAPGMGASAGLAAFWLARHNATSAWRLVRAGWTAVFVELTLIALTHLYIALATW